MSTEEGNRLIAEYSGYKFIAGRFIKKGGYIDDNGHEHVIEHSVKPTLLQFDKSWDLLMPVVEKISKTIIKGHPQLNTEQYVRVEIIPSGYVEISNLRGARIFTNVSVEGSLVIAVWKAVVIFIERCNQGTEVERSVATEDPQ